MLSHQIEDKELASIEPKDFVAEWKWDGIRVQAAHQGGEKRLFSRTGDDISGAFPDVVEALPEGVVLDGELLVMRDGEVAPFNDLQQRLNRKTVTGAMLKSHPAHIRLYDMLFEGEEDLRALPFAERRARLEAWHKAHGPRRTDISSIIDFASIKELEALWAGRARDRHRGPDAEAPRQPLYRRAPQGPLVQMEARAAHHRCRADVCAARQRQALVLLFGLHVRRLAEGDSGEAELVPVGKSYFGFTDEELNELDRWVRNHTVDSFGPVRQVEPKLVFEVAFDSVHRSTRHKSGVAMRFPRIHRIRWDKPAEEADRLETLAAMIVE